MTISMACRSVMLVWLGAVAAACTARPADETADSSTTIVTVDSDSGSSECDGPLSHSHTTSSGTCVCDAGYEWENPEDPDDFDCVPADGSNACMNEHNVIVDDQCLCEDGYTWCEPDDPNDYTCCGDSPPNPSSTNPSSETDASSTDPTDADTTAGDTDGPTPPNPADCTVDTPDVIFCSNTEAMGPEDSVYWVCIDGEWVDMTTSADEQCQFDNYDFAYGCIDDGQAVAFICGNGTGAPCENADDAMCIDMDEIDTCIFGRATQDSCATLCQTIGDEDGVTYDGGFCDTEAKQAECICCDEGECP